MAKTNRIPRWDLNSIYTSLESEEYRRDLDQVDLLYHLLKKEVDAFSVNEDHILRVLDAYGNLSDVHETLDAYVHALMTVDTTDGEAVQGIHDVARKGLLVKKGRTEMVLALAPWESEIESLLSQSDVLEPYIYTIRELLKDASHLMTPGEEEIAYALQTTGADAFARMHEVITSTSSILWEIETGERKTLTELRALAFSPRRDIRKRAYQKELELLEQQALPLSFCLNGIKGSALTLYKKRNYSDAVSCALDASRITREVLDALISSIEESLPLFNRYFKAKAAALGLESLSFYDLFAPLGVQEKSYSFAEAKELIISSLEAFHPAMGSSARGAFRTGWIDAEIREGKVGGAYCTFFPSRGGIENPLQLRRKLRCPLYGSP